MCGIGVLFQEDNAQLDTSNLSGEFKLIIDKILSQAGSDKNTKVIEVLY